MSVAVGAMLDTVRGTLCVNEVYCHHARCAIFRWSTWCPISGDRCSQGVTDGASLMAHMVVMVQCVRFVVHSNETKEEAKMEERRSHFKRHVMKMGTPCTPCDPCPACLHGACFARVAFSVHAVSLHALLSRREYGEAGMDRDKDRQRQANRSDRGVMPRKGGGSWTISFTKL